MTTPCEQKLVIKEILTNQREMGKDIKSLVETKNKIMGIYALSRIITLSIVGFIGWLIGTFLK